MADDQATLGRFADRRTDEDDPGAADGTGGDDEVSEPTAAERSPADEGGGNREETVAASDDADLVCPWCLAPASAFESGGLTGRWCGRCSAVLPVEADWFRAREVVARRPMYHPDGADEQEP